MPSEGAAFRDELSAEEWRDIMLQCLQEPDGECAVLEPTEFADELEQ